MATTFQKQRKYVRHKAPKGMSVVWKSSGRAVVSRAEVVGMGGLFLHTLNPLAAGSMIELLFELETGDVRARASVRSSVPGKGMGVQFVQMQPADRSRLNQFLAQYEPAASGTGESSPPKPMEARKTAPVAARKSPQVRKARSVRRCSLVASVEVVDLRSGTQLSARISELAMGGCYVDALNPFPEGTPVRVRIVRDEGVFESKAKVVYCHPASGMGLIFTQMAAAHRSILEDWLAAIVIQRKAVS